MKTYKQRAESVMQKVKKGERKSKRITAAAIASCATAGLIAIDLVLFLPYGTQAPSVAKYGDSEYYPLIQQLNTITFTPPKYKNNFEKWTASIKNGLNNVFGGLKDMYVGGNGAAAPSGGSSQTANNGQYVETTDNQTQGVIEGDLIKRTDKYIFYLSLSTLSPNTELRVYSIEQADSRLVAEYAIPQAENTLSMEPLVEMYLSQDGTQVTVIRSSYVYESAERKEGQTCTEVISLDVSDLADIKIVGRTYLSGLYVSSRMADGKLLLVNDFRVRVSANGQPDFSDEKNYLPQYGVYGEMQSVAAEDIVCPESASSAKYTVVCELDEKTLETSDCTAFLSYSEEVYVSEGNIYLTYGHTQRKELGNGRNEALAVTDISCVSFAGEGLEYKGSFTVEGSVKNQYSMDEYDNMLRVVTTYSYTAWNDEMPQLLRESKNANLYCVALDDFSVVGKKEKFAPEGEMVESVRFDGEKAYVCTAVVVTMTDPVFAFDLSDPTNITSVDTGIVDGYSFSLVDFTDGTLLGMGYADRGEPKLEIYEETETGVETVCVYTLNGEVSEEYKAWLIDRENGLIGFGANIWYEGDGYNYGSGWRDVYCLLLFDGYGLTELVVTPLESDLNNMRAVYIDGWLYMFGDNNFHGFAVENVFPSVPLDQVKSQGI